MTDSAAPTPLHRTTLIDALTSQVEEQILSGELDIGSRLPSEEDLGKRFGVSRPVVREALARLRERGLIETISGSGTYVRSPSPEDLSDTLLRHIRITSSEPHGVRNLYETRLGIEVTTARLAAERATTHDLDDLKRHLDVMRTSDDVETTAQADADFHIAIARASHNPFLLALLSPLVQLIRQVIYEVQQDPAAIADGRSGHARILDALAARDADAAADAMRTHLLVSQRYSASRFPGDGQTDHPARTT